MAHENAPVPAKRIQNAGDLGQIIPDVIGGVGGAVGALALTTQIDGHDVKAGHQGGKGGKTARVIHPSMQGQHRKLARLSPRQPGKAQAIHLPLAVAWL